MHSEAIAHGQTLTAKESLSAMISLCGKGEVQSITTEDDLPEGSIFQKAISMCLGDAMDKTDAHSIKNLKPKYIQELARHVRQAARSLQNSSPGTFFGKHKVVYAIYITKHSNTCASVSSRRA